MKIAIIGSGGREHAMFCKLSQNIESKNIFVLPGNGGIPNSSLIDIYDFEEIKKFCNRNKISILIIGSEQLLADGIVDYFKGSNTKVFGPSKAAAVLEASKIEAKYFMKKYEIPTADFREFAEIEEAIPQIKALNGKLVLKYDKLAQGKGTFICNSVEECMNNLNELQKKYGEGFHFLIEKQLKGQELSLIGITDGKTVKLLTPTRDYKQIHEGGLNTGGMGAYCPVDYCTPEVLKELEEKIVNPTIAGIQKEGFDYKGFIYFGIMLTEKGPKLLEYNVRMGDPEAQVMFASLKSNLVELISSCFEDKLNEQTLEFNEGYFLNVVLVSGGYPLAYRTGYEIMGHNKLGDEITVFHAGTLQKNKTLLTDGGRVLNLLGSGKTIEECRKKVYEACKKIHFKKVYFRKDIGE